MKYNEIFEDKSTNIFELNPKLENLLYRWYGGQTGRDKFLELTIPNKYKVPPKTQYVYRYINLKPAVIAKLVFDKKVIQLKARFKTSSWSPDRSISKGHWGGDYDDTITLVVKKQIKQKDIVIYTPNITKYHRDFVYEMDTTAREAILGEKELIVRNTPYWLNIKPEEIISLNDMKIGEFIEFAEDYFPTEFLKKKGIAVMDHDDEV